MAVKWPREPKRHTAVPMPLQPAGSGTGKAPGKSCLLVMEIGSRRFYLHQRSYLPGPGNGWIIPNLEYYRCLTRLEHFVNSYMRGRLIFHDTIIYVNLLPTSGVSEDALHTCRCSGSAIFIRHLWSDNGYPGWKMGPIVTVQYWTGQPTTSHTQNKGLI